MRGELSPLGILIDHPPNPQYGDPAICSVAQMNHISGLSVPVSVGSSTPLSTNRKAPADLVGACFLLDTLRRSPEPVTIYSVGSSRDIALACRMDSALFREKCRGVYLNAGTGTNDPELRNNLEYNVSLDPAAYRSIFDLPCPLYWLPCFHAILSYAPQRFEGGPYGSFYSFIQEEILPDLSPEVQRYFLFMFERSADQRWLSFLHSPNNGRAMEHYGKMERRMWCTAGFLHSVGLGVDGEGRIVKGGEKNGVFGFEPIRVECDESGATRWEADAAASDRFIFTVRDGERYGRAMKLAMKALLKSL